MNKLMELYEKRNKAVADARAFLESKRGDNDVLSDEDNLAYEKMEKSIMALSKEIEREGRLTAIDVEMSKPTSAPILNNPTKPQTNNEPKTRMPFIRVFLVQPIIRLSFAVLRLHVLPFLSHTCGAYSCDSKHVSCVSFLLP